MAITPTQEPTTVHRKATKKKAAKKKAVKKKGARKVARRKKSRTSELAESTHEGATLSAIDDRLGDVRDMLERERRVLNQRLETLTFQVAGLCDGLANSIETLQEDICQRLEQVEGRVEP
jgi:hypothetical protein